jgi:ectoine hydroxylase-related dioxygenase (phytanoyl-CoA dioxygenase family)
MEKQEILILNKLGFLKVEEIYTYEEVEKILQQISKKQLDEKFGVRYFLKDNPEISELIFNEKLKRIIQLISREAFVIKSIYFDKPPNANWIVNWHQDITINVEGNTSEIGFSKWRKTKSRIAVQPPLKIIENIFTIRIHLDDCSEKNGALRIIPKSHRKGIINSKVIKSELDGIKICEVKKGGILIMKPLILHSSKRSENQMNRRIIHIEFSSINLPKGLEWLEKYEIT